MAVRVKFVNEFTPMSLSTRPVGRKEKAQATKDNASASGEVVAGPAFEPAYVYKVLGAMQAAFPVEGRQEDAEEFLTCLLNGLNDEMLEVSCVHLWFIWSNVYLYCNLQFGYNWLIHLARKNK